MVMGGVLRNGAPPMGRQQDWFPGTLWTLFFVLWFNFFFLFSIEIDDRGEGRNGNWQRICRMDTRTFLGYQYSLMVRVMTVQNLLP